MANVFISFVHEDQRVADAVARYLSNELKQDVFVSTDQWQVFAGEIWLDRIRKELAGAKVVVLMLSRRSVVRPWVNFEAGAAWLQAKPIIPVCYGNLTKDSLPKPYSAMQALNLASEKYYLLTSVAHFLGIAPPPGAVREVKRILDVELTEPGEMWDAAYEVSVDAALQAFEDAPEAR
jgi:hypothetical protein